MSNSPGTDKDSAKAAWHNYSMCLHTLHGNNALIEQNYNNSNRVLLSCFTTGVIIVTCLHMLHGIMLLINISNSFTMAPTNGSLSQKSRQCPHNPTFHRWLLAQLTTTLHCIGQKGLLKIKN